MRPNAIRKQRGIALVTALLLVALAGITAADIISRQHLDIRRARNVLAREQAYSYALAAESWMLHMLWEEAQQGNADKDHLNEDWAQPFVLPDFEGASIVVQMHDAQARFNLNNLATAGQNPGDNVHVQRFLRLVDSSGVADVNSVAVANAVMDWLDEDLEDRFPGGAEDGFYTQQDPPYRAANRLMASATELRLVRGVDQELYEALLPLVTALPTTDAAININTASAAVLRSVHPMSAQDAEALVDRRPEQGYDSVADMLQHVPAGGNIDQAGLGIKSERFRAETLVELGPARVRLYSLLRRDGNRVNVVARTQGPL